MLLLNTDNLHITILCGCSTQNICMYPCYVVAEHRTSVCTHVMWLLNTNHLHVSMLRGCWTQNICVYPCYVVAECWTSACAHVMCNSCIKPTLNSCLKLSSCTYASYPVTKHRAAAHMQVTLSLNTEQLHICKLHCHRTLSSCTYPRDSHLALNTWHVTQNSPVTLFRIVNISVDLMSQV
jgi:hypothetical protein